jgi:MFS family permease
MKASLLVSGGLLLAFPLVAGLPALAALTFAWAIAGEAFRPASLAAVTDLVAPEQRKAAYALTRLAINIGMSIGPAAGGLLALASFSTLFLVDGVTSVLAGALLAISPWRTSARVGEAEGANGDRPLPSRRALADRRFLFFLAAVFANGLVFFQHEAAMALFLVRDLGLSEVVYGALFTVNTLLIVLLEIPLNGATAAWTHRRTLATGALLYAVGFGGLALVTGVGGVAATVVIWTFGEMILMPGMAAYVAETAPPERRGEYMGLYTMAFSLAFAVGPWAGTEILDRFGATVLWGGAFVCGALAAAMMARVEQPRSVR